MTILYKGQYTVIMVLPRERLKFMEFLHKKGYEPVEVSDGHGVDGTVIAVKKEVVYHKLVDAWDKHTGYDKILKKLLDRYKK